ncbi:dephospho-CoA kinase [Akkermansiaceae bacterium]|nr:dephospho-CoA kinase [Akkermansiaceae bacterium]MDB4537058.1 dephospho-CoA kinase [Akkermansiaceae bacterium]
MGSMIGGMKVIALTGGIATGKSTLLAMMKEGVRDLWGYDCDEAAQRLLGDLDCLREIQESLGESILTPEMELDRPRLRKLVFENSALREKLEEVIHPKLRKECLEKVEECRRNQRTTLFVADVPLLFEGGFDFGQEINLVVATSDATQRTRLKARSHFDDRMISSILLAQLPIMEKVVRADVVFWNEGRKAVLQRQLSRFLDNIFNS